MEEERIGTVIRFFPKPMVAAIAFEEGSLAVGDALHIRGRITDLYHRVDSIEIDGRAALSARPGDRAGIRVPDKVRARDEVFFVKEGKEDA